MTIENGMKQCSRGEHCVDPNGPLLPITSFYTNKTNNDGLQYYCKACRADYNRNYLDKYRERPGVRDAQRARDHIRAKTPHKKASQAARQGANYDQALLAYQYPASNCEICGSIIAGSSRHLDHDHKTGMVRGWLCNKCNQALGLANDNAELLRKMAMYIEKYEETS